MAVLLIILFRHAFSVTPVFLYYSSKIFLTLKDIFNKVFLSPGYLNMSLRSCLIINYVPRSNYIKKNKYHI